MKYCIYCGKEIAVYPGEDALLYCKNCGALFTQMSSQTYGDLICGKENTRYGEKIVGKWEPIPESQENNEHN